MGGFPGPLSPNPSLQTTRQKKNNFQINAEILRVLRLKLSCIFSVEPHRTGHSLYHQSQNCSVTLPSIIFNIDMVQKSALINFAPKWLFSVQCCHIGFILDWFCCLSMCCFKIHPDPWNLRKYPSKSVVTRKTDSNMFLRHLITRVLIQCIKNIARNAKAALHKCHEK